MSNTETFGFDQISGSADRNLTYLEAISEAITEEMERDPNVLVLGEDVGGEFGGAFKVTQAAARQFDERRVLNTPLAELSFTGMANGMALMGLRPIIEMQFADFITTAFDSIVQFAATTHYRAREPVPWVIRAPSDGGIRSGPFHSQNPEAWFVHTPGLKVVAPGTPADAKGLLLSAIRDDNPVIYFESKPLYRSLRGPVPSGDHVVPLGSARQVLAGNDLSILTYGSQLEQSRLAAELLSSEGISIDLIDLRSLKPLDTSAILESVSRTGKVLIVHAANRIGGVGAEISALISEEGFDLLDAPLRRLGGLDTPIPFSPPLEEAYRPNADKIAAAARELAAY